MPTKTTKTAKSTKAAKTSKPTKVAKTVKASKITKSTKTTKTTKVSKPAKASKSKEHFSSKELAEFQTMLAEKKAELIQIMKSFQETERSRGDYQPPADISDAASDEIASTLHFRIHDKNRKLLNEVNNAILKFQTGDYGICEGTGDYINKERLRIRPWTRYSIEYKEYLDEEKRRSKI